MNNSYLDQLLGISSSNTDKKRAFISFDYDHDQSLKNLLAGQAKLESSPFYFEDWSVKEPFPQSSWKSDVRTKIKQCDFVLVALGLNTHNASGVLYEIGVANEERIPCFGIYINDGQERYLPKGLGDRYIVWDWNEIKQAIDNLNRFQLPY